MSPSIPQSRQARVLKKTPRPNAAGIRKRQPETRRPSAPPFKNRRKRGISDATFYNRRGRYGGMEVSDARRLRSREDENRRLKKLLAESMLDVPTLEEKLGKF